MKQNELRIGNWISDQGYETIVFQINETHVNDDLMLDHFEPIPLTEEWLVRFGFEKSDKYGYFLSPHKESFSDSCFTRLCFFLEEMDFIVNSNDYDGWNVHCEYVHQLQNIYVALTGEELELK